MTSRKHKSFKRKSFKNKSSKRKSKSYKKNKSGKRKSRRVIGGKIKKKSKKRKVNHILKLDKEIPDWAQEDINEMKKEVSNNTWSVFLKEKLKEGYSMPEIAMMYKRQTSFKEIKKNNKMDVIYQIENNIPSNASHPTLPDKVLLYAFVKSSYPYYPLHDQLQELSSEWKIRGWSSRAQSTDRLASDLENYWSYYFYHGPLESRSVAETRLYQYLNNLKNEGKIVDFRIRHNFIDE